MSYFLNGTNASSNAFATLTVMNVAIYNAPNAATLSNWAGLTATNIYACVTLANGNAVTPVATIDHLQVANITTSGPTITINGGVHNNNLVKYGKTARCEMTDALAQADVLQALGGAQIDADGVINITEKFAGAYTITGDTFIVDQKTGRHVPINIIMYQFLPDSVPSFTFDKDNAGTFDLSGDLLATDINIPTDANLCGFGDGTFFSIIAGNCNVA